MANGFNSNIKTYSDLNEVYDKNLSKLDRSQKLPVFAAQNKILIKAPAGSGKTLVLTDAVAHHRYENLNDKICAITFTRAAREEMQKRLTEMGVYDVAVSTIHVWCRNELERFGSIYGFTPAVLFKNDVLQILTDIIQQYLLTHRTIRSVNVNVLYSYIDGNKKMEIDDKTKRTFKALEDRYILYKRRNHLYDYTDYPLYLKDVMEQYHEEIKDIDALFVDEFQDVDEDQLWIFNHVKASKFFFIGDSWQSIYGWRGATSEVFDKVKGFTNYKLKFNYRSYQEIINISSAIYENLSDGSSITKYPYYSESAITCVKGKGGLVLFIDSFGEVFAFGKNSEQWKDSGYDEVILDYLSAYHPMILCRTNKQVKAIQEKGYADVSTIHSAKGLEYENTIVIDFPIEDTEDKNIAYVAMTRAKNNMLLVNWSIFSQIMNYRSWEKVCRLEV